MVRFELQGDDCAILAEAELAWKGARLAVLRPDQQDQADAWQVAGWAVVILGENWEQQVTRHVTGFPNP